MKKLLLSLWAFAVLGSLPAWSQSEPVVAFTSTVLTHEHKGWRVTSTSPTPIRFNLVQGDLIVRIDGKNASETGPMQITSLFSEGPRRAIHLFIERGGFGMEINLRELRAQDYDPVGANPFRHVTTGFNAPDLDLKDIDGQPVTQDQFKDKWILIDFIGTWCPPCFKTMSETLRIADDHKLGLVMVALNDKADAVRRMRQNYKINAPIVMTQFTSPLPISFGIATNDWAGQIPGLVLIRPNGEVALIQIGYDDPARFAKTLDSLIGSKTE